MGLEKKKALWGYLFVLPGLLILLIFSLVPLIVVTFAGQKSVVRLGETVFNMAKRNRTEIVTKAFQQTAEDQANIFDLEIEVIEFSLMGLAREVERLLAENPKTIPTVYFAEDFDDPEKAPTDMVRSPRHLGMTAGGRLGPIPISLDNGF